MPTHGSQPARAPRLVWINTHPLTTRVFLRGQLRYLRDAGFDVTAISAPGRELDGVAEREGVDVVTVPMEREIRPARDLSSLAKLLGALRRLRPDIVQTGTPKASLLGLLAARLLGVPVRVYLVRGLRLETTTGWKLRILRAAERLTARCAHLVLCESPSLREKYVELGLAPRAKTAVVGPGMLNGVDAAHYSPARFDEAARTTLRRDLRIPEGAPVIGFVGRFTRDKGIEDLLQAFAFVRMTRPEARLLLVGDFERGDPVEPEAARTLREAPEIARAGFVDDTAPYYSIMDVLAFPSAREGFPATPMEAAAMEVPVVGYRATGTVDAIDDGRTGMLVAPGDVIGLAESLERYLSDQDLRTAHGRAGRERVLAEFRPEQMWELLREQYAALLEQAGLPLPVPRTAATLTPSASA